MSRSLWIAALGLLVLPVIAMAQPEQGRWELTLTGGAVNNNSFDNGAFVVNGSIGYFITKEIEAVYRQSVGYADLTEGADSSWLGVEQVAIDYHFNLGNWQPFVGVNGGYQSGFGLDSWEVGIEGGVKYFLNKTTFIFGRVEYDWLLDTGELAGSWDDGMFVYQLGIGLLF